MTPSRDAGVGVRGGYDGTSSHGSNLEMGLSVSVVCCLRSRRGSECGSVHCGAGSSRARAPPPLRLGRRGLLGLSVSPFTVCRASRSRYDREPRDPPGVPARLCSLFSSPSVPYSTLGNLTERRSESGVCGNDRIPAVSRNRRAVVSVWSVVRYAAGQLSVRIELKRQAHRACTRGSRSALKRSEPAGAAGAAAVTVARARALGLLVGAQVAELLHRFDIPRGEEAHMGHTAVPMVGE